MVFGARIADMMMMMMMMMIFGQVEIDPIVPL
jgi:hypothetical protein